MRRGKLLVVLVAGLLCAAPAYAAQAPGAPGSVANWTRGDKTGFGTSHGRPSVVARCNG